MVIVLGKGKITDEVTVAGEALDRLSKFSNRSGFLVELPDEDGLITRARDEDVGVFVFSLRVSCLNSSDPVSVALEMTNFGDGDL